MSNRTPLFRTIDALLLPLIAILLLPMVAIPRFKQNPMFCPVHLIRNTLDSLSLTGLRTPLSTLIIRILAFTSPKKEVNLTLTILLLTTISEAGSLPDSNVLWSA